MNTDTITYEGTLPGYTVTLNAAGCLPDSEFWPVHFDTLREAWEFVANEVDDIPDDEDFLPAHTALHVQNRDQTGSIPVGDGTYAYRVEVADLTD